MRLYRFGEVQQLAWRVWGGQEKLEEERERRREQRWQLRQKQALGSVIAPQGPGILGDFETKLSTQRGSGGQGRPKKRLRAHAKSRQEGPEPQPGRRRTVVDSRACPAILGQAEASAAQTPTRPSDDLVWEVI